MDALLPDSDLARASDLYGKYKNIKEKTVVLCDGVCIQYYLLRGASRESNEDVYSILCVKTEDGVVTDSEFVFDISSHRTDAERVYGILCRNTVTPMCMLEALDNILFNLMKKF